MFILLCLMLKLWWRFINFPVSSGNFSGILEKPNVICKRMDLYYDFVKKVWSFCKRRQRVWCGNFNPNWSHKRPKEFLKLCTIVEDYKDAWVLGRGKSFWTQTEFELEIQCRLAIFFWANVGHHGWLTKKISIFMPWNHFELLRFHWNQHLSKTFIYLDPVTNVLVFHASHTLASNIRCTVVFFKTQAIQWFC